MRITAFEPVGAQVTDVALADITDEQVTRLQQLLAEHGVLVLPDQHIDDTAFLAFLHRCGTLTFATGETPVAGFEDLNVVSNVGRSSPPRSVFHTDTSYLRTPPLYTALRAVQIPQQGGETLFTNQYRAYDTLPQPVVDTLQGRTIHHVVSGLELTEDDETAADHPVFRTHPLSGRTAVYMSTPQRCVSISDMDQAEAEPLIQFLYEHSTTEDNTYRHAWAPGDVVIWDNSCVLHRGDHSDVIGDRVMHRGMVTA